MLQNVKLERLRFSLRGSLRKFSRTWNPSLTIIDSLDFTPDDVDARLPFTYSVTSDRSSTCVIFVVYFCFYCGFFFSLLFGKI